jgi:hypothetical protein
MRIEVKHPSSKTDKFDERILTRRNGVTGILGNCKVI